MTLIAAIAQDHVLANQLVEGGVDASVFENFLHETLRHLRSQPEYNGRPIVLIMDNASIHHHAFIVQLANHYHAFIMYSAEYSPWLNPVEAYFWRIK